MEPQSQVDGAGQNGAYFWKRREEKYEMPVGKATFLRDEIEKHLPLFEFRRGHPFTFITTVYFDTEKLDFYKRAKTYYDDNIKIRVKEYYYQGRSSSLGAAGLASRGSPWITFDYCFVEIKQRIQGLVVKRRFELPKRLLAPLLRGEDVWDDLIASRSGIEFNGFVDVYREFRWYVQRYQVYPKSIINYRRSVYQEDEQELRVTFDDEIAVYDPLPGLYEKTSSLARSYLGEPKEVFKTVIMEIKCQNGYPPWLSTALRSHMPKRLSKFTESLNVLTQELPRLADAHSLRDTHLVETPESGDTTEVSEIRL